MRHLSGSALWWREHVWAVLAAAIACSAPPAQEREDSVATGEDSVAAALVSDDPAVAELDSTAPGAKALALTVEGDGLRMFGVQSGSARSLPFGTPSSAAREGIERALGSPPLDSGSTPDCQLDYATWPGGLTTTFRAGTLVGWSLRAAPERLTTVTGVGIGSTRADLEEAYDVTVEASSLGTEFSAGGFAGVLESRADQARVTALWAGEVCLAR